MVEFRARKGDVLFEDGNNRVITTFLQRRNGEGKWVSVLELRLESGRAWGDKFDYLFRSHSQPGVILVHISGFGYWGDAEYYRSEDNGITWEPANIRQDPDPKTFSQEEIPQL